MLWTPTCLWKVFISFLLLRPGLSFLWGDKELWGECKCAVYSLQCIYPLAGVQAWQTRTLGQIAERGSWLGKCCQLVSYPHLFSKFLSSICTYTNMPSVEGSKIIFHQRGCRKCAEPWDWSNSLRSGYRFSWSKDLEYSADWSGPCEHNSKHESPAGTCYSRSLSTWLRRLQSQPCCIPILLPSLHRHLSEITCLVCIHVVSLPIGM